MQKTWTIGAILNWTKQYFGDKGVENPRLDAEVLLSHILGKDRLYLYVHFDQPLEQHELARYRDAVKKRVQRLPVAYITGSKEFMGLEFKVSADVLIPRPDTEILVEAAVKRLAGQAGPAVLDLGVGSGAILVSVLYRLPEARGTGVDISAKALEVAAVNAVRHGVASRAEFRQGDLFQPVQGMKFDAILSNPPYIPDADIAALAPEVRNEPRLALAGGVDGLDFYRRIIGAGAACLNANGFIALEAGMGQADSVAAFAAGSDFVVDGIVKDYGGIDRVVLLRLKRAD